jgi:hypothetical protein
MRRLLPDGVPMTADRDLEKLIDIVANGIRVLRTRDKVAVTDAQCIERARNIVSAVIVTFELRSLPPMPGEGVPEPIDEQLAHPQALPAMKIKEWARLDFDTPLIHGPKPYHGWSCRCDTCDLYKRSVKT